MGIFFKDEPEVKVPSKKAEKPALAVNLPQTTFAQSTSPTTSVPQTSYSNSEADQAEFASYLENVFKERNFPGPDYQEYTNALVGMQNLPIDEASKFNAAYLTINQMGCDKIKLISTANEYIKIFNKVVASFNSEIDNVINTELAQKQKSIDSLKSENDSIEDQMRQLTEKRNKNNELINSNTIEVNNETHRLNSKKIGFESAAKTYISKIETNIQKINQYILPQ